LGKLAIPVPGEVMVSEPSCPSIAVAIILLLKMKRKRKKEEEEEEEEEENLFYSNNYIYIKITK
jgi:hypothetical protein